MMGSKWKPPMAVLAILCAVGVLAPSKALGHCDGMDGPVVKAARRALETGDVNLILIWVQKVDEAQIREAFEHTMAVRTLSPTAKALADRYFFETVVRIHRAGEGAQYTGLKPAGRDLGPAIPAADKALEARSVDLLLGLLIDAAQKGIREHFQRVAARADFAKDDVSAGQEYVKAYVEFVHYVERIYEATKSPAHGHYPEAGKAGTRQEECCERPN